MIQDDASLGRHEGFNPRRGATLALFVLLAAVVLVTLTITALMAFTSESCAQRSCDYELVAASGYVPLIGEIAVFVLAAALALSRAVQLKSAWWIPLLGVLISVIIFFAGWAMLAAGTHLSFAEFFGPVQP